MDGSVSSLRFDKPQRAPVLNLDVEAAVEARHRSMIKGSYDLHELLLEDLSPENFDKINALMTKLRADFAYCCACPQLGVRRQI